MSLFARLRAWFVSSVLAPELPTSAPREVDVALDEDDLFESVKHSAIRLKIGGVATRAFEPSDELLERARDEEAEDEITRRVDVRELREKLAASGRRRR